uniref:Uncharacterized protein n=1 Tax=Kalanchoe fedtschenkoi TaxID=63787 RepID=A0A7N0UET6_KALFE
MNSDAFINETQVVSNKDSSSCHSDGLDEKHPSRNGLLVHMDGDGAQRWIPDCEASLKPNKASCSDLVSL